MWPRVGSSAKVSSQSTIFVIYFYNVTLEKNFRTEKWRKFDISVLEQKSEENWR